jgi:hypothetical protein
MINAAPSPGQCPIRRSGPEKHAIETKAITVKSRRFGIPAFIVDFWRKSNKPPFDSLQSFLGLHFASRIIARSAVSPDLTKNQPIGP